MHDGGVVTSTKLSSDPGQREVGKLACQVHRDLPRKDDRLTPFVPGELCLGDPVVLADLLLDGRDGDRLQGAFWEDVLQNALRYLKVDRMARQRAERDDADQRPLQLPDVGGYPARDETEHLIGDRQGLRFDFASEDGDSGLKIRRLDVGDQSHLEPASQAILDASDVFRWSVRG